MLISLDTVRRDHLGVYGYERPTTPRLDELARTGAVYDQAITASTQTGPAHASFFTGLHPHEHGAEINGVPIRDDVETLAERLAGRGYDTAAFVSGYPLRTEACGLDRGFSHYDDDFGGKRRDGAETVRRAAAWLGRAEAAPPRFLFLHLYDAHGPYLPPPGYEVRFRSTAPPRPLDVMPGYQVVHDADGEVVRDFEDYRDRYDTMIRYQDDLLAGLLDRLSDPGETRNLADEEPERRDRMLRALETWYTGDGPPDPESLPPEVRERLESLGYVGG